MKKKLWLITAVVLMLIMGITVLVACSDKDDKDDAYVPNGSMIQIDHEEFVDYLVDCIANTVETSDEQNFYIDFLTSAVWEEDSGRAVKYVLGLKMNLDINTSSDSRDTEIKFFIEEESVNGNKNIITIYYKDGLVLDGNQPKIYLSVGDTKFAYEAFSLKALLTNELGIEVVSDEEDSLAQIKEIVSLVFAVLFDEYKVRDDGQVMTMQLNLDTLYSVVSEVIKTYNTAGEIDAYLQQLGLNLTVEQLTSIKFSIDSVVTINIIDEMIFDADLEVIFNGDHPIVIEDLDGNKVIDIFIASGKLTLKLDNLAVNPGMIVFPAPDNLDQYKVIGLLNVSIDGQFNFYKADGTPNNDTTPSAAAVPMDVTLRMDINPFVLLRGISEDNISELGVFHLRVKGKSKTFLELIFDPANTGTANLFVIFNSMAGVGQKLTFDIDDTIAILSKMIAPQSDTESVSSGNKELNIKDMLSVSMVDRDGQSNLMLTLQMQQLNELVDSLLPGGIDILGAKLMLSTVLFGGGTSYATLEFTDFAYGEVARDYNATVYIPKPNFLVNNNSLVKSVNGIVDLKTEYKLGEAFQFDVNQQLQLDVTDIDNKNAKLKGVVIDVEGFDPNKLGEQTVTVRARDNTGLIAIIAGVIEGGLPAGLPLGVLSYTFTINVTQ